MQFDCNDVLFGVDGHPHLVNLIILVAKQFIVNQNYRDGSKEMPAFHAALAKMFEMEKHIAKENNKIDKFRLRWG